MRLVDKKNQQLEKRIRELMRKYDKRESVMQKSLEKPAKDYVAILVGWNMYRQLYSELVHERYLEPGLFSRTLALEWERVFH